MADYFPSRLLHESDASLAERVDSWHKRNPTPSASPVALTDEQIIEISKSVQLAAYPDEILAFARAILAASPATAQGEGFALVKAETIEWLLGERGEFECPLDQYFLGKPAPHFWRRALREAIAAARPPATSADA